MERFSTANLNITPPFSHVYPKSQLDSHLTKWGEKIQVFYEFVNGDNIVIRVSI